MLKQTIFCDNKDNFGKGCLRVNAFTVRTAQAQQLIMEDTCHSNHGKSLKIRVTWASLLIEGCVAAWVPFKVWTDLSLSEQIVFLSIYTSLTSVSAPKMSSLRFCEINSPRLRWRDHFLVGACSLETLWIKTQQWSFYILFVNLWRITNICCDSVEIIIWLS